MPNYTNVRMTAGMQHTALHEIRVFELVFLECG